eukprot:TRINITY_DN5194_c0_g1_i1.p1 TRINITY_DN5194_c0_g1~~TRINITY_DN5194_c0_g1_i1.p1  ORF type:complete len:254 (-),score=62.11 TRINITY_DN5194_c0_g1_i1:244-1005(-)
MSSLPSRFDESQFSMDEDAPRAARPAFIIGVCGGTASGKTTVCSKIIEQLKSKRATIISQDSFYRPLMPEQREAALKSDFDFDHPDAFDFGLMLEVLQSLRENPALPVTIPVYDFKTHQRSSTQSVRVKGVDVVIFEGIMAFHNEKLRDVFDMKLFVDTDDDLRLMRRLRRDIAERGRDVTGVLQQYERFVKPAFDNFISPAKKFADLIIPRGGDNVVAIDLIVKHIQARLDESSKLYRLHSRVDFEDSIRNK